jgi:hypothetical protein
MMKDVECLSEKMGERNYGSSRGQFQNLKFKTQPIKILMDDLSDAGKNDRRWCCCNSLHRG